MENITTQEYMILLDLIENRKEGYTDEEVSEEYHNLSFLAIKLDRQIKLLDNNNKNKTMKESIQTKIDNLEGILNKYHDLGNPFDYSKKINAIESQIDVLKEILSGDLGVEQWNECYMEDEKRS